MLYQTLNPPYHEWTAQRPPLQAGVLAAAQATGARLLSMETVYMYGRPNGRPLTEDRPNAAHTTKGRLRARMAGELLAAHCRKAENSASGPSWPSSFVGVLCTPTDIGSYRRMPLMVRTDHHPALAKTRPS
ncbi:hypothetical protein [Micromonospora cremea]|uniref:hypothetical protein n=1 Tax=Micromonospora cremea TaxID=709881 RepID=UPI00117F887D|nr:hypothetical protein [Micromonospora cremea]